MPEGKLVTTDEEKFNDRAVVGSVVPAQDDSANSMLMMAIRNKYEPAFIREMMDLRDREQAHTAKQAFVQAKANFKKKAPVVIRDMENKQYGSKYASETALINTMTPFLAAEGLDISFEFPETDKGISVTCILTHELGHSERVTLFGPADSSGSKNPLQQVKSTVTYLRKATFEAITGIASSNPTDDDDGNAAADVGYISVDQQTEIEELIEETKSNKAKFLEFMGVSAIDEITQPKYGKAVAALNAKLKR